MTDVDRGVTDTDRGLHRRTVLQGAVWSMPVIALSAAAPAAAASGGVIDFLFSTDQAMQVGYQVNDDDPSAPIDHIVAQSGEAVFTITPVDAALPAGTVVRLASTRTDGGTQAAPPLVFSRILATDVEVGVLGASVVEFTLTAEVPAGASKVVQYEVMYGTTILPTGQIWYALPSYEVTATIGSQSSLDGGYWRGVGPNSLVTRYGTVYGYGSFTPAG